MNLYKHQQQLLDINPQIWALVWSMGTGKTIGSLALANKNCKSILIICPKGLKTSWERAVKNFPFETGKSIEIITKETFRRDHKKLDRFECVICDECHHFLGTKSAMMKSLRWYLNAHKVNYRYFLTGTPYRSSPMDIYVLATLLGYKMDYLAFFNRFFYRIKMGHREVPMVKNGIEEEIAEIVNGLGNTVKLSDCIDMPPQTFREEYFELTKEQKEAIKMLDDVNPVVRYGRIHQICGGTIKGDEYTDDVLIKSSKEERLFEVIEELDKVIVVCRYNLEIEKLQDIASKRFKDRKIAVINGSINNRQEILDELETHMKYVLFVNGACSEGWQLQSCSHMVFYSYDFSLKNKLQMEARITRIDAPRPTFYLSLICKDTIDQAVYETLGKHMDFHIAIYKNRV